MPAVPCHPLPGSLMGAETIFIPRVKLGWTDFTSVLTQVLFSLETMGIWTGHPWKGFLACLQFSKPSEGRRDPHPAFAQRMCFLPRWRAGQCPPGLTRFPELFRVGSPVVGRQVLSFPSFVYLTFIDRNAPTGCHRWVSAGLDSPCFWPSPAALVTSIGFGQDSLDFCLSSLL